MGNDNKNNGFKHGHNFVFNMGKCMDKTLVMSDIIAIKTIDVNLIKSVHINQHRSFSINSRNRY